ncbi:uncharacterized protein BX664DRAFT_342436 [Halteromyces radiatus]|uniref:uncharacterized protein n=1 Tax=Halteromyces radiatus TaxID=101107 RepID=UPI00221E54FE|nr:uncharacterized protein BX664DRAFT_342436 [Halteromyces radiatus]KAI8078667.1 hypothetical protein BX664DRAFT_342436 [Halteromyces radiatus]
MEFIDSSFLSSSTNSNTTNEINMDSQSTTRTDHPGIDLLLSQGLQATKRSSSHKESSKEATHSEKRLCSRNPPVPVFKIASTNTNKIPLVPLPVADPSTEAIFNTYYQTPYSLNTQNLLVAPSPGTTTMTTGKSQRPFSTPGRYTTLLQVANQSHYHGHSDIISPGSSFFQDDQLALDMLGPSGLDTTKSANTSKELKIDGSSFDRNLEPTNNNNSNLTSLQSNPIFLSGRIRRQKSSGETSKVDLGDNDKEVMYCMEKQQKHDDGNTSSKINKDNNIELQQALKSSTETMENAKNEIKELVSSLRKSQETYQSDLTGILGRYSSNAKQMETEKRLIKKTIKHITIQDKLYQEVTDMNSEFISTISSEVKWILDNISIHDIGVDGSSIHQLLRHQIDNLISLRKQGNNIQHYIQQIHQQHRDFSMEIRGMTLLCRQLVHQLAYISSRFSELSSITLENTVQVAIEDQELECLEEKTNIKSKLIKALDDLYKMTENYESCLLQIEKMKQDRRQENHLTKMILDSQVSELAKEIAVHQVTSHKMEEDLNEIKERYKTLEAKYMATEEKLKEKQDKEQQLEKKIEQLEKTSNEQPKEVSERPTCHPSTKVAARLTTRGKKRALPTKRKLRNQSVPFESEEENELQMQKYVAEAAVLPDRPSNEENTTL